MKKQHTLAWTILLACILLGSCKKKDDDTTQPAEEKKTTYSLSSKDVLGVSGTITFIQKSSSQTEVDLVLSNAPQGSHPAFIKANSAAEGGLPLIYLNPVDSSGKSVTLVTQKLDFTSITYDDLIKLDGFVEVEKSLLESTTVLAQGDIGGNVLTGDERSYPLNTVGSLGVSGTFRIQKRQNGFTLATVTLLGTVSGDSYPANVHIGSITTPGDIVVDLNNIQGLSSVEAKSMTTIRSKKDNSALLYDDLVNYTGYVNVDRSDDEKDVIIAQGNIGSNVH